MNIYVPVKLEKTRNFCYNLAALDRIETSFKKPWNKIDFTDLTIKEKCTIIWAGLAHEDAELTPNSVMELIDKHSSLPEVMEILDKAFEESFPKVEEDEKNFERAEKNSV